MAALSISDFCASRDLVLAPGVKHPTNLGFPGHNVRSITKYHLLDDFLTFKSVCYNVDYIPVGLPKENKCQQGYDLSRLFVLPEINKKKNW